MKTLIFSPLIKAELAPSTKQVGDVSGLITAACPARRWRSKQVNQRRVGKFTNHIYGDKTSTTASQAERYCESLGINRLWVTNRLCLRHAAAAAARHLHAPPKRFVKSHKHAGTTTFSAGPVGGCLDCRVSPQDTLSQSVSQSVISCCCCCSRCSRC